MLIVREGVVEVTGSDGRAHRVVGPEVMFQPRAVPQSIIAGEPGAQLVCAAIDFGSGEQNPLIRGMPDRMSVSLTQLSALNATVDVLFAEAVAEVAFVQLMRHAVEQQLVDGGVLAGLADARLARALTAMQEDPARNWSLASLAVTAGMSRSRFAARFSEVVGVPAMEYLVHWRVGVAQGLLRRGRPAKVVALEVGYCRSSTFGRAFAQVVGATPMAWLRAMER